ncbi:tripartite tricarboxylate transporter substrate-binding protein [Ottowia beijingensis]|uniref:tripartite tricarboxylate transporter substrate-binding protein n=1 Tax=Ottowia beijingensis TaxID=1207057 RepID=UPI00358DC38E
MADYQAWIKTSEAAATFGHGATGSGPHFLGELLGRLSGVKMTQTGYRGSQPALLDLLGGHIPAVAAPLGEFLPHMKSGKSECWPSPARRGHAFCRMHRRSRNWALHSAT